MLKYAFIAPNVIEKLGLALEIWSNLNYLNTSLVIAGIIRRLSNLPKLAIKSFK
jgi:hypothetical protein